MKEKAQKKSEPSWLDPRNDRKTPFTDAELDVLADDLIARMADTQAKQRSSHNMHYHICINGTFAHAPG